MRILLAGVRGTTPTADAARARFGGETTCFLIQDAAGNSVIVDAGTGLRVAMPALEKGCPTRRVLLLMSHYHLDHVEGLPRLPLLYRDGWTFDIAAPRLSGRAPADVLPRLFEQPFWPVQMSGLKAAVRFVTLPSDCVAPHDAGGLSCRWCAVHHPEGCFAYRIEEKATGRSVVIATDIEWDASTAEEKRVFERLCAEPRPPDVLIWDGQFTPEDYDAHRGWGHSRWTDGAEIAARAGARQLLITHHAPDCDDRTLRSVENALRKALPHAAMARQGMVVSV
jgi:ribonuclease BN (tRNA processing enzyme)